MAISQPYHSDFTVFSYYQKERKKYGTFEVFAVILQIKFLYLQRKTLIMTRNKRLTIDEILKLKATALYVINKCQDVDLLHLFKILYFADKEHYAVYGRRIINDTFCALQNGPVPSFLYDAIKVHQGGRCTDELRIISDSIFLPSKEFDYYVSSKEQPDMDELSASDIEMLDKSISENKDVPFGELSKRSHDIAWRDAWEKQQNSPIDPLLMARAAGASDATIDYIRENEFFDQLVEA